MKQNSSSIHYANTHSEQIPRKNILLIIIINVLIINFICYLLIFFSTIVLEALASVLFDNKIPKIMLNIKEINF